MNRHYISIMRRRGVRPPPSAFLDAYGLWYIDQHSATPRPTVPNANTVVATSANLFTGSRNLFAKAEWWVGSSITETDTAATAPDGTTSASTLVATGNSTLRQALHQVVPAGTYTLAVNAKRNTGSDQSFAFYHSNTGTRSNAKVATDTWQRFTFTFTIAESYTDLIGLGSIDGSTAYNVQICDFELYAGAADLGPAEPAAHMYLGASAFDTRPSYADGALDLSANGYGLVQFGESKSFSTITVQALVSKVAAGAGYASLLSKPTSYSTLSLMTEQTTAPYSYFGTGAPVGPAQFAGLWVAASKGYHVITLRYDGTQFDYWIDDVRVLRNVVARGPVSAAEMFVNITNSTTLYGGNKLAGALALWDRALTDAEIRAAVDLQQARAAASSITATSTTRILVAEGDSITGAASFDYPYLFGPNANPALYGVVYAVSGSTIANLNTRATIVDGIIPPSTSGRKFILSVLIGANGLGGAADVPAWLASLATYLDARRAAGWTVVLCTVLPSTAAGFNANRNTANATLSTWVGTHCDALCDFAAEATMGPDAAASNATYYSDGTHPTAAGQALLEVVYRAAVNAV